MDAVVVLQSLTGVLVFVVDSSSRHLIIIIIIIN